MSTSTTNWGFIKPELSDTADITQYNSNWDKLDQDLAYLSNVSIIANSDDGVNYHGTLPEVSKTIDNLNGIEVTIIPSVTNTSTNPTLNLNDLGAVPIRLSLSTNTSATIPVPVGFFVAGRPVKLMFDVTGGIWETVDKQKTSANDLYGQVPISSGGFGGSTAAEARENLEITPANIGALPDVLVEGVHYGTEAQRPEAGQKGRIYFQVISS